MVTWVDMFSSRRLVVVTTIVVGIAL
jgi:hypothetical protein